MARNSNEYMREYMNRRYHRRRADFITALGGVCVECGTSVDLEFDHNDPKDKSFTVGDRLASAPLDVLRAEVAKCSLRCITCHLKRTISQSSVDHGGGVSGKKNCPCELCKPVKAAYMRSYAAA